MAAVARKFEGGVDSNNQRIINVGTPTSQSDAVPLSFIAIPSSFSVPGTLVVKTGVLGWVNDSGRALTIKAVRLRLNTAPTGAAVIFDVKINGTSIYNVTTANRPTVAAGASSPASVLGGTPDTTAVSTGDVLTVDVTQIGSTIAGADAVLTVWLQ